MENKNREHLDTLKQKFKEWLYFEDEGIIYTLAATKLSHQLPGDPLWLMIIGPSSGGKSELLKAFKQEGERSIDDLTDSTFVTGYKNKAVDHIPQFAELLADKIWYIMDMSLLMSKNSEERSSILSDMRMIYDGLIKKGYGNKQQIECECKNNTLICGSTPVVDNLILEDQLLGTRFVQYRIKQNNRSAVMDIIDRNQDRLQIMREQLNQAVKEFETLLSVDQYVLNDLENKNLQIMSNTTTLLRTAVSLDRLGEPMNLSYPEEPGRFYKQMKKMYQSYRIIGLTEEESLFLIRKICMDNINPLRIRLIKELHDYGSRNDASMTTSKLHQRTGIGKKAVKSHLHCLNLLGIVDYKINEDQFGRVINENWRLLDCNVNLLLGGRLKLYSGRTLYNLYARSKIGS